LIMYNPKTQETLGARHRKKASKTKKTKKKISNMNPIKNHLYTM
jgi:hypothetical protein